MKYHSQVFIALFVLILLINIYPLNEEYTNKQTQISNVYSDNSNNSDISNNQSYDHKWLNTENGGSSSEFKISDNFNSKFTNPFINNSIETSINTINKPDFKLYSQYWPISDN